MGPGDTVRLRNGEEIVVAETYDSYRDVDGEHQGPFFNSTSHDRYLVADAEIVRRNENRCEICGEGVTSKDPEKYPYCRTCHYTGQVEELLRAEQLAAITTALDGPAVAVWHTGGGCMMLTVSFSDEPGAYYGVTDGEASLPSDAEGRPLEGGWGLVIRYEGEEDCEGRVVLAAPGLFDPDGRYWNEYPAHAVGDDAVVSAIREDREKKTREEA